MFLKKCSCSITADSLDKNVIYRQPIYSIYTKLNLAKTKLEAHLLNKTKLIQMTCVALLTTSSKSSIMKEGTRNARVPPKLSFETEDGHKFDEFDGDFSSFSFDILLEILTNDTNL